MLITVAVGVVVGVIHQYTVNGGGAQPTPMVIHCLIVSVVVTFWLAIMWGGWPFTLMRSPIATGLALLTACYLVNYLLFQILFNYAFLEGAPVYVPALDPGGLFNGGTMVVFYVTFIAIMFLFLHFDLWPMTTSPSIMKQPVLGIVWTVICLVLGGGLFYVGVVVAGMDPQAFMVTIPIPFIFGTIIVLNMMHNSIFGSLKQPAKGAANAVAAMVVGSVLAVVYGRLAPTLTGPLAEGPPAYEYEIWLASALLAVTFPFLIFFAEFFKMWPMMKVMKAPEGK
jgi:hypothetical protein